MKYDDDTGEIFEPSISERAVSAGARAHGASVADAMGIGKAVFYVALAKAAAELDPYIAKDARGGHGKYASLQKILSVVRPILMKHGILIRQGAERSFSLDEGGGMKGRLVPVYTDLIHVASGEVDRTIVEIPVTKLDPQAMGSAVSYGRRYSILAALGLATDEADDDGEAAKPQKLTERQGESYDLSALKREMDGIKDPSKLAEWGGDQKQIKRLGKLTPEERALARKHYEDRGRTLLTADDEPSPAPAKTERGPRNRIAPTHDGGSA